MKSFQFNQVLFKPLGFGDASNLNIAVAFSFLAFYAIFSSSFFLFKYDKTFSEFVQSFYICISTITYFTIFIIIIWKKSHIFKFIDAFENLIEKRKFLTTLFKTIYQFLQFLIYFSSSTGCTLLFYK